LESEEKTISSHDPAMGGMTGLKPSMGTRAIRTRELLG